MFGQKFNSFNLSDVSEAMIRNEALSDAEREEFFNAIHGVQSEFHSAYQELMDIAIAADDPEMIQTIGGLSDATLRQKGYTQAAYADQLPHNADCIQAGKDEYCAQQCSEVPVEEPETCVDCDAIPEVDPVRAEPQLIVIEDAEQNDFDSLYDKLVPDSGNCETIGGELLRATMKIAYRYYNDGDYINQGYGKETCNAAARFLMAEANSEIKELVKRAFDGDIPNSYYEDFITKLQDKVLEFIKANHLDTVANYKNLDYLDYGTDEDVDDYEDEDDEYDESKHAPYIKEEEDFTDGADMGDISDDSAIDIPDGGDMGDFSGDSGDMGTISMDEESISDLIEDKEIHEILPEEDSIVVDKEDPTCAGKVLNVHDDKTLDVKWADGDITRNTSVEDVAMVKAPESFKVYMNKTGVPEQIYESDDPVKATAMYNHIKSKNPTAECYYLKPSDSVEDFLKKFSAEPVNEESKDDQPTLLDELANRLNLFYTAEIEEDGTLTLKDKKGNYCYVTASDEQPVEIALNVEMADGDTSETINYIFNGLDATADFIAAAFGGEVSARGLEAKRSSRIFNKKSNEAKQKTEAAEGTFFVKREDGLYVCDFYDADHNFCTGWALPNPMKQVFPLKHAFATEDSARQMADQLDKARTKISLPTLSYEIVTESDKSECGTVADLGLAPILPASTGTGLTQVISHKIDDEETKRLLAKLDKYESLESIEEFKVGDRCLINNQYGTIFKLYHSDVDHAAGFLDDNTEFDLPISQVKHLKAHEDLTPAETEETILNALVVEPNKEVVAQSLRDLAKLQSRDLITTIDFLPESAMQNVSTLFGSADSEEIANEIESFPEILHESKNESILGFSSDAPITALDDQAQFTVDQALELSKVDPVNNDANTALTYQNQNLPPVEDVEREETAPTGFIPLEPITADANDEIFADAVAAVADATKLTDTVDAYTKLKELYPNAESKQLARNLKEAFTTKKYENLVRFLCESTSVNPLAKAEHEITEAYGADAWNSISEILNDFDMTNANHRVQFVEQAKMVVPREALEPILNSFEVNEDTFENPILNDANNNINKRADGSPMATTNATGNDPVTPTLADTIDPAQITSPLPADQSEIDAITGKDSNEPNFDAYQQ